MALNKYPFSGFWCNGLFTWPLGDANYSQIKLHE